MAGRVMLAAGTRLREREEELRVSSGVSSGSGAGTDHCPAASV